MSESASPAGPQDEDLLEQVASMPNLASALLHVASNAGAAGVDGRTVDEVVGRSRSLLPHLRDQLRSGRYRPGDIRRVWIPKPGGGQRGLGIPNVVDRWVQQAVFQVLEPIFEPTFRGGPQILDSRSSCLRWNLSSNLRRSRVRSLHGQAIVCFTRCPSIEGRMRTLRVVKVDPVADA